MSTGAPIVYTSGGLVLQVAAHEEVMVLGTRHSSEELVHRDADHQRAARDTPRETKL